MEKKKNTSIKKTNKRGRPPKKFKSQKVVIKRDKPGRPPKNEQYKIPQIPERTNNKTKDITIITLFSISLLVFCFSIYINQRDQFNKTTIENPERNIIKLEEKIISGGITTKTGLLSITGTIIAPESITKKDKKSELLEKFYGYIKEKNIENIYQYIDSPLIRTTTINRFFTESRLNRFIENIDQNSFKLTINNINKDEVMYTIKYSINNILFTEERKTTITQKDDGLKIAKIMCITTGCSRMPFFNPGKYF